MLFGKRGSNNIPFKVFEVKPIVKIFLISMLKEH